MRIIFSGSIGRFPVGGHAWVDMQYLLGLRELGHDVYYLEECGQESWVYNWHSQQLTTEMEYPCGYVRECLAPFGLAENWIYRAGDHWCGMPVTRFREACAGADLMIIRAVPVPLWRPEYDLPARRVFIDMDPPFTQIHLAHGHADYVQTVAKSDRLFTIAQRIGLKECLVPTLDRKWHKTVPPVMLAEWESQDTVDASDFTSVLQWRSYPALEYRGIEYGNKDREFPRFAELPRRVDQSFLLALTGQLPERIQRRGWVTVEGWRATETMNAYRGFVQQSRAEFSVAKHAYVASRCGWFSDRSACYLASGRPVLAQDTGLAEWLPTGRGLLTFSNLDEAVEGVEQINADYDGHCRAARALAEEYFATTQVLPPLLDTAMN